MTQLEEIAGRCVSVSFPFDDGLLHAGVLHDFCTAFEVKHLMCFF